MARKGHLFRVMKELVVHAPLNVLSLGQTSYNILRELYKKGVTVSLFPTQNNADLSAYNVNEDFKKWMDSSLNNRFKTVKSSIPTLKIWHLSGSEQRITRDQFLYVPYELDFPDRNRN